MIVLVGRMCGVIWRADPSPQRLERRPIYVRGAESRMYEAANLSCQQIVWATCDQATVAGRSCGLLPSDWFPRLPLVATWFCLYPKFFLLQVPAFT